MKQLLNNSRHGTMLLDLEEKERQSLTLPIFACLWSLYGREKCPEGGEEKREEDAREGGAERGAERGEGEAEEALHDIITGNYLCDRCCLILTNTCRSRCVYRFLLLFILRASCSCPNLLVKSLLRCLLNIVRFVSWVTDLLVSNSVIGCLVILC